MRGSFVSSGGLGEFETRFGGVAGGSRLAEETGTFELEMQVY